jgi:cell division protein FtsW (lipid II flippase)
MSETKVRDFDWRLPICGALGAVILLLPTLIWGNDAGAFFASVPLAVFIAVILLAVALTKLRRQSFAVASMICIFLVLVLSLFRSSDYLRTTTRWLIHSQSYKMQLLNQPTPSDGSLKHVEWDGWGFPGAGDTTVYLVNDPSDQLEEATKKHLPGKFSGIPCEAVRVRRLESHWYTVLFYTDTDWSHCA